MVFFFSIQHVPKIFKFVFQHDIAFHWKNLFSTWPYRHWLMHVMEAEKLHQKLKPAHDCLVTCCLGSYKSHLISRVFFYIFFHRLFKTIEIPQPFLYSVSTSPNPITTPGPAYNIKLSCDRHLLAAAHKNIAVGPVLAVLKGILVVGDATCHHKPPSTYSGGKRSGLNTPVHPGSTPKSMVGELSQILGTCVDGDEQMSDLSYVSSFTFKIRP